MIESTFKYGNVELTYLKHAGFKIKGTNAILYIDPYEIDVEMEKADVILVTHDHFDHLDLNSIGKLSKSDTIVVHPRGCKVSGYETLAVSIGAKIEVKGVEIEAVPAYNVNKPFHRKGVGVGYVVKIDDVRIYHAGDTDRIPEMKKLNVDIALLPIGGTYTMDIDEAIKAAGDIKAKYYIPMHYGVISGTEADPNKFNVEGAIILKPLL